MSVNAENPGAAAGVHPAGVHPAGAETGADSPAAAVGALYEASALGLIRMAYVMLGDLPSAEDVVPEAFVGLYRRWDRLADPAGATYYVRTSVLNGCRSVLRRRTVRHGFSHHGSLADPPSAVPAETVVLGGEEREDVIRTFVLAAQKVRKIGQATSPPATRFFLLRLSPASSTSPERALLTPLPIPAFSGNTSVWDFALSPDGTRLAVASGLGNLRLSVVNVATGTTRTWEPGGPAPATPWA